MQLSKSKRAIRALRELSISDSSPSAEERSEAAKVQLRTYAALLSDIVVRRENEKDFARLAMGIDYAMCHLYTAEHAMKERDWALALHELDDIFYNVAFWHEIVYTNLVRIFNCYLDANIRIRVSGKMRLSKKIQDVNDARFCMNVIHAVNVLLRNEAEQDKRLAVYDWALMVIKEAYRVNGLESGLLGSAPHTNDVKYTFPDCWLENGIKVYVNRKKYESEPIPVSETCLVSFTWKQSRILPAFLDVKTHGFKQNLGYYGVTYYPEANMCVTHNGFHHTAMASLLQKGSITPSEEISLAEIFLYVKSDGCY